MEYQQPDFKPLDTSFLINKLDDDYAKMIQDMPGYEESIPYEQSENQIKLLNQLIELQNKSMLDNQKSTKKGFSQNRLILILMILTLIATLCVPFVLSILGF